MQGLRTNKTMTWAGVAIFQWPADASQRHRRRAGPGFISPAENALVWNASEMTHNTDIISQQGAAW